MKKRIIQIFLLLFFLLFLIGVSFFQEKQNDFQVLQQEEQKSIQKFLTSQSECSFWFQQATSIQEGISKEQLKEPELLTRLSETLSKTRTLKLVPAKDNSDNLPFWETEAILHNSIHYHNSFSEFMDLNTQNMQKCIKEIKESKLQKDLEIAREELKQTIESGETTYADAEGEVADESTRENLNTTISTAKEILSDNSIRKVEVLTEQKTQIESSIGIVQDSIAKQEQLEEEEQRRQEALAAAATSSSSHANSSSGGSNSSSNIWYAEYYNNYYSASAAEDGSLTQWADGYFIAHDWSYNGQMIARKPSTVVINGRSYHYVSSIVVSRDTMWEEVSSFVLANGGIGFQTCTSGGYLITHYEPN